jgi:flavin reductase (DIM6/NTAB) family NADH-FMN oxidoreductase RutF
VSGPGEALRRFDGTLFEGRGSIDPALLREALGSVRSPVAVVTSFLDGRPHGATVSAFCSLSVTPPLVLTAVDAKSELLTLLRDAGAYGINVLADGQQDLARTFARTGGDPFDGVSWTLENGVPRLAGAASWVMCRLEDLLPGGDHLIAIGHVVHAEAGDAEPLLYRSRSFGTLAGLPAP